MTPDTLPEWLAHLERLHPNEIELGLTRVQQVLARMGLTEPPYLVLTIAGTNGKGSCVAMLESILRAAGYRTGAYTSPHLLAYNERIRIDGIDASDAVIVQSLRAVEGVRADLPLTFFEFGTVAALAAFKAAEVDVALLEVGMGGRLDAVNAVEPLAAIVTSIDLDHQDWLGKDRETIGREKAGIFRAGKPAVLGDTDLLDSVVAKARDCGARLLHIGHDFSYERHGSKHWTWRGTRRVLENLPVLNNAGEAQYRNAACALAALEAVADSLPVNDADITVGLQRFRVPGRFQIEPGSPQWVFDVAHNGAAARELASNLAANPVSGQTVAVFGMLRDKPVDQTVHAMLGTVDRWRVVATQGSRSLGGDELQRRLEQAGAGDVAQCENIESACQQACSAAGADGRVVVFGSFHVVGPALHWHGLYSRRETGAG